MPEGSVPLVRVERVEVDLSETVETVDPVERSGAVWSAVGVTLISGAGEGREGRGCARGLQSEWGGIKNSKHCRKGALANGARV